MSLEVIESLSSLIVDKASIGCFFIFYFGGSLDYLGLGIGFLTSCGTNARMC